MMKFGKVIILVAAMVTMRNVVMAAGNQPDMSDPAVRSRVTALVQDQIQEFYSRTDVKDETGYMVVKQLCDRMWHAAVNNAKADERKRAVMGVVSESLRTIGLPANLMIMQRLMIELAMRYVPFCCLGYREKLLMDVLAKEHNKLIQGETGGVPIRITGEIASKTKNARDASELMAMMYNPQDTTKLELSDQAARKEWLQQEWNTFARGIGEENGLGWKRETTTVFVGFTPCTLPTVMIGEKDGDTVTLDGRKLEGQVRGMERYIFRYDGNAQIAIESDATMNTRPSGGIPVGTTMNNKLGTALQMIAHWHPDLYYLTTNIPEEMVIGTRGEEQELWRTMKKVIMGMNSGTIVNQVDIQELVEAMRKYGMAYKTYPLAVAVIEQCGDAHLTYQVITDELWGIYGELLGIDYRRWRQTRVHRRVRLEKEPLESPSRGGESAYMLACNIAIPAGFAEMLLRNTMVRAEAKKDREGFWGELIWILESVENRRKEWKAFVNSCGKTAIDKEKHSWAGLAAAAAAAVNERVVKELELLAIQQSRNADAKEVREVRRIGDELKRIGELEDETLEEIGNTITARTGAVVGEGWTKMMKTELGRDKGGVSQNDGRSMTVETLDPPAIAWMMQPDIMDKIKAGRTTCFGREEDISTIEINTPSGRAIRYNLIGAIGCVKVDGKMGYKLLSRQQLDGWKWMNGVGVEGMGPERVAKKIGKGEGGGERIYSAIYVRVE